MMRGSSRTRLWVLITVLVVLCAVFIYRLRQDAARPVTPVRGNPDVPPRPEEALRLERMFEQLLEERDQATKPSNGQ